VRRTGNRRSSGRQAERLRALGAVEGGIIAGFCTFLFGLEGGPAATGSCGVGVHDLEPGIREVVREIDLAALEILEAVWREKDTDAILGDHLIVLFAFRDLHGVLQAGTTSSLDSEAKSRVVRCTLRFEKGLQFRYCLFCDCDHGLDAWKRMAQGRAMFQ